MYTCVRQTVSVSVCVCVHAEQVSVGGWGHQAALEMRFAFFFLLLRDAHLRDSLDRRFLPTLTFVSMLTSSSIMTGTSSAESRNGHVTLQHVCRRQLRARLTCRPARLLRLYLFVVLPAFLSLHLAIALSASGQHALAPLRTNTFRHGLCTRDVSTRRRTCHVPPSSPISISNVHTHSANDVRDRKELRFSPFGAKSAL